MKLGKFTSEPANMARVIEWLEAGGDATHRFDLDVAVAANDCGTTCCIGGLAYLMATDCLDAHDKRYVDWNAIQPVALIFLGIVGADLEAPMWQIFSPNSWLVAGECLTGDACTELGRKVTPQQAAVALTHFTHSGSTGDAINYALTNAKFSLKDIA